MSITINADLEYIKSRLNISDAKMEVYQNKTVEEIIEAEAAQGNQQAIQLAADMFTSVDSLIELFRLSDENNKLVILKSMNSSQLDELVPMLEADDLVEGLRYFNQDKLLEFLGDIPKEELIKVVFELFSQTQIVQFMPEKEIDRFLTNYEMDKGMLLNNLQRLPELYLQQMMESITGEENKGNSQEIIRQMAQLGDGDYKQAIRNLQPAQKQDLTYKLTTSDNKLYERFDTGVYTSIINRERDKEDMVKAMGVIKPEYLQKMIVQLPQDLQAVVTTQIDTEKFADALITKFPELIAKFVAG